jgi:hypothetical protein
MYNIKGIGVRVSTLAQRVPVLREFSKSYRKQRAIDNFKLEMSKRGDRLLNVPTENERQEKNFQRQSSKLRSTAPVEFDKVGGSSTQAWFKEAERRPAIKSTDPFERSPAKNYVNSRQRVHEKFLSLGWIRLSGDPELKQIIRSLEKLQKKWSSTERRSPTMHEDIAGLKHCISSLKYLASSPSSATKDEEGPDELPDLMRELGIKLEEGA